jgi:hypothetical protein
MGLEEGAAEANKHQQTLNEAGATRGPGAAAR